MLRKSKFPHDWVKRNRCYLLELLQYFDPIRFHNNLHKYKYEFTNLEKLTLENLENLENHENLENLENLENHEKC